MQPMYLETETHANCCGVKHICEFWDNDSFREYQEDDAEYDDNGNCLTKIRNATLADKVASIKEAIRITRSDHGAMVIFDNGKPIQQPKGLAIEVTLSNHQWSFWERALRYCGFRRKLEFRNSNSGNRVRIYYLVVDESNENLSATN